MLTSQSFIKPGTVLLQTFMVRYKKLNEEFNVRAITDTGIKRTFINEDVVETLRYNSKNKVNVIHKLFMGVETKQKLHHQ